MRSRILIAAAALLALQGCATAEPTVPEHHPPAVGQPVLLDTRVRWETSAWLADRGLFCVRAARTDGRKDDRVTEMISCEPAPAALDTVGPPLLPGKPQPQVLPPGPQEQEIVLVGTARGDIASVSVTMFGQTATGTVHPLPATGDRQVGAYAVWLPRSGPDRDGMNLSDITAVVGRNAAGSVVAQL